MSEDDRVKQINTEAAKQLSGFLLQLETGEITENQMVAIAYASMITVAVLGFSPKNMAKDAAKAAKKLLKDIEDNG